MRTRIRQSHRASHRGIASVEFALLVMPVVLIMLAIVEFGRAVLVYNLLVRNVRDAARHVAMASPAAIDVARGEARCLAYNATFTCDGDPSVPDLTPDMIDVPAPVLEGTAGGDINLVQVSVVGYAYGSIFLSNYIGATVPFNTISASMRGQP